MNFYDWDMALSEQCIELEEAAKDMCVEMSKIREWEEARKVPQYAINYIHRVVDEECKKINSVKVPEKYSQSGKIDN